MKPIFRTDGRHAGRAAAPGDLPNDPPEAA